MTSIDHGNDASLAGFLAKLDWANTTDPLTVGFAVIGLTNFGERPVPSARLAEVLGWPVSDAEALTRQGGFGTRVEDGLITVNPERARAAPRRQLQIGERRFGVTGCAPDVFLDAPLIRPSLQVEETCPATRTPIRLMFTPSGVESADPAGTVVPILPPQEFDRLEGIRSLTDIDASFCAQCPSAPPRRRLRDIWPLIPAAASSQSGRRGI